MTRLMKEWKPGPSLIMCLYSRQLRWSLCLLTLPWLSESLLSRRPPPLRSGRVSGPGDVDFPQQRDLYSELQFNFCATYLPLIKASKTAKMDSLFDLHMSILSKQIFLNVPSTPVTSIALTSILVSRNGTFSGTCSLLIWTSKKIMLLGSYLHGIFERVAKVNMGDLSRGCNNQNIADVSISQAQYVANHAHQSQWAYKIRPALEPYISWGRLKPENACEIVSSIFGYFLNIMEHFNFL